MFDHVTNVGADVQLQPLPSQENLRNATDHVSSVGMDVCLDAIQGVAQGRLANYSAEMSGFRIHSRTATSTADARVSAKERKVLTPLIQSFAESLAHLGKIARINPNLNTIAIIQADGTRKTIYADTLEGEAKARFETLKMHYNTTHGGFAHTRPTFRNEEKANVKGYEPFYTKEVSADPSAKKFIKNKERFSKITEGMTEEKKLQVEQRIRLAEIFVVKKMKQYENLIKTVDKEIKTALREENEDEVLILKGDLLKLKQQHQELQRLDPIALYWLVAFYPEDPNDKEECMQQASEIEKMAKTLTQNHQFAYDLASVLIKDREEYYNYCGRHGIYMQNTKPMENILREIVRMESAGIDDRGIEQILNGYESDIVRAELVNIDNELKAQEIASIQKIAPKKIEMQRRVQLANEFVNHRLKKYETLLANLQNPDHAMYVKIATANRELQTVREEAIAFLQEHNVLVERDVSTEELIQLLQSEQDWDDGSAPLAKLAQFGREIKMIHDELKASEADLARHINSIQARVNELRQLNEVEFTLLAPYYEVNPEQQKKKLSALVAAARRLGYGQQQIKGLKEQIMRPDVRKVLKEMRDFKPDTDATLFANAALAVLQTGGEFLGVIQNLIRNIEREICDAAKQRFLGPVERNDAGNENDDLSDDSNLSVRLGNRTPWSSSQRSEDEFSDHEDSDTEELNRTRITEIDDKGNSIHTF
jgi:hypothetical protein